MAQKLKIKNNYTLLVVHAPANFSEKLDPLPEGVSIADNVETCQQIHWFVRDKAQMDKEVDGVVTRLAEHMTLWIYFPKGSSKIQTDLTRDKGWENLLKHNLVWLTLISFDNTWSAFSMRLKTATVKEEAGRQKERPILQHIDAAKKEVFLPEDFAVALNAAAGQKAFFEQLSFTNKKEYLEWIVSAKKDNTRKVRISESIQRMAKGWKNPANR